MRLLIASPRKTGNAQLRCLLASAYGLELIGSRDAPDGSEVTAVESWLGDFPDRRVAHTTFRHSPRLAKIAAEHDVMLVAVIRHPFDLLVSIHEIAQRLSDKKGHHSERKEPWAPLAGRALDDPAVLTYLSDGFSDEISWLKEWHDSGAPLVRFELLEADPAAAVTELATVLGELDEDVIARAVAICPGESMVRSSPVRGRRMPPVPPGTWRSRLSDDQLVILRDRYGDDVRHLGYELV